MWSSEQVPLLKYIENKRVMIGKNGWIQVLRYFLDTTTRKHVVVIFIFKGKNWEKKSY
jgi:hypothetical protein